MSSLRHRDHDSRPAALPGAGRRRGTEPEPHTPAIQHEIPRNFLVFRSPRPKCHASAGRYIYVQMMIVIADRTTPPELSPSLTGAAARPQSSNGLLSSDPAVVQRTPLVRSQSSNGLLSTGPSLRTLLSCPSRTTGPYCQAAVPGPVISPLSLIRPWPAIVNSSQSSAYCVPLSFSSRHNAMAAAARGNRRQKSYAFCVISNSEEPEPYSFVSERLPQFYARIRTQAIDNKTVLKIQ